MRVARNTVIQSQAALRTWPASDETSRKILSFVAKLRRRAYKRLMLYSTYVRKNLKVPESCDCRNCSRMVLTERRARGQLYQAACRDRQLVRLATGNKGLRVG